MYLTRTASLTNRLKELNLAHLARGAPEFDEMLVHVGEAAMDIAAHTQDDLRKRVQTQQ